MVRPPEPKQSGVSSKSRALAARLNAVQALYQAAQNKQSIRTVLDEYLTHRAGMEVEGEALVKPDGVLLKKILFGVEERRPELDSIIDAHLKKDAQDREVEPLLRSILICGAYELFLQDIDSPIIINDYLNVGHSFYERSEVALLNGVLDAISRIFK